MIIKITTDLGASLEQNGLGARAPTEGKSAHGFGSSVVEAIEHLVQPFMTQGVHEGFTSIGQFILEHSKIRDGAGSHVWPWEALESVELQRSVFGQGRSIDLSECCELRVLLETTTCKTYRLGCTPGLFLSDLLNSTLDLGEIHSLVVNLDHAAQDGAHLCKLVLIPRDKIELCQSHHEYL